MNDSNSNGKPVLQRTFKAELELREGRILEGCCVPYGEAAKVQDLIGPDTLGPPYYELFEPGAFRKQLRAADKLELNYEHRDDLASSIGVCRELLEQSSGLYGVFQLHRGPFGDQALELVRSGVLWGFSVDFEDQFRHWQRTPENTVVRQNCRLRHVALTRSPAYQGAQVLAMRSRAELEAAFELPHVDDEQLERLRAVGVRV
jgi:HK97 family phage prohead protease